jgi:hypothetical protein
MAFESFFRNGGVGTGHRISKDTRDLWQDYIFRQNGHSVAVSCNGPFNTDNRPVSQKRIPFRDERMAQVDIVDNCHCFAVKVIPGFPS